MRDVPVGKGSTKNERKANTKRVEAWKAQEAQAKSERRELLSRPVNQRPENYAEQIKKLSGIIKKARAKQGRSPNDTQSGKRGAR